MPCCSTCCSGTGGDSTRGSRGHACSGSDGVAGLGALGERGGDAWPPPPPPYGLGWPPGGEYCAPASAVEGAAQLRQVTAFVVRTGLV